MLVDNHGDSLSTVPEGVTSEFANLIDAGAVNVPRDVRDTFRPLPVHALIDAFGEDVVVPVTVGSLHDF